jgi:cytochrome c oxidase subunit 3
MERRSLSRSEDPEHGRRQPSFNVSIGQLGVYLLLGSLAMLFTATIVAYLVTRSQAEVWQTRPSPEVTWGLVLGTATLAALSGSLQYAPASIRANRARSMQRGLWLGSGFAVLFVVLQAANWFNLIATQGDMLGRSLYAYCFFLLTGVHIAHVLGGFVPLGIVLFRASSREYSSSRFEGVRYCVQYWHFLGAVWLVLLGVMLLTT